MKREEEIQEKIKDLENKITEMTKRVDDGSIISMKTTQFGIEQTVAQIRILEWALTS